MNRLAILGGKPVRNTFLAYGRQWIDDHDVESVVEVLKGDYLTTGPCVEEFERRVAACRGRLCCCSSKRDGRSAHGLLRGRNTER